MGKRLSRIYTRTGDQGTTGLGTNTRIAKSSARIHSIGDVDELNSWLGHIRAALTGQANWEADLQQIQHDLFDLGGELAMPGYNLMAEQAVSEMETRIDQINQDLPRLQDFILPAGGELTSRVHLARAVARRAERSIWALWEEDNDAVSAIAQRYLNRLSDYLFVLARAAARSQDGGEVLWQSRHTR